MRWHDDTPANELPDVPVEPDPEHTQPATRSTGVSSENSKRSKLRTTRNRMDNPDYTVDGRFTQEGLSVSVYDEQANVVDETWFTWDEIEELKSEEGSDFTMEINE